MSTVSSRPVWVGYSLILPMALIVGCGSPDPMPFSFSVVTFNSGTTQGLAHEQDLSDDYGNAQADLSDQYYGDGLAWTRVLRETTDFFAQQSPDIVGFQEIFHAPDCAAVPPEARPGFICDSWQPGDPTVAQVALGAGYQVVCHLGKNDKCIGVRKAFGTFAGCDQDLCLDGLDGEAVPDCGRGARVARGTILPADGAPITITQIHGSSGLSTEDVECRVQQFRQAFTGLGARNIILGDLNIDPIRLYSGDASAKAFLDAATASKLSFMTEVGEDAAPTYGGLLNIDHILSDIGKGTCQSGVITEMTYFDHRPQICVITPTL